MTLTVTFTELELNAVLAGIDNRIAAQTRQQELLKAHPRSLDRQFALEATRDAIRDATRAKLRIAAALVVDDTVHWQHSDDPTGIEQPRPGRHCGPSCDLYEDPDRPARRAHVPEAFASYQSDGR